MKIKFVTFIMCVNTLAVAIRQGKGSLAQVSADIEAGNPYENTVDNILEVTKDVLDGIYGTTEMVMEKSGELKKKIMEPVRPAVDKVKNFTKDRENDLNWASGKVIEYADRASHAIDDNISYHVNSSWDYIKATIDALCNGLGYGFYTSKGHIPTPRELLDPRY